MLERAQSGRWRIRNRDSGSAGAGATVAGHGAGGVGEPAPSRTRPCRRPRAPSRPSGKPAASPQLWARRVLINGAAFSECRLLPVQPVTRPRGRGPGNHSPLAHFLAPGAECKLGHLAPAPRHSCLPAQTPSSLPRLARRLLCSRQLTIMIDVLHSSVLYTSCNYHDWRIGGFGHNATGWPQRRCTACGIHYL